MNGHKVASEIKLVKPTLLVILLSGRELPKQALASVDAFLAKLDTGQQLLPMIGKLCSQAKNGLARRAATLLSRLGSLSILSLQGEDDSNGT